MTAEPLAAGDDIDQLLGALDEFTNAIHWLRQRSSYTAESALSEALTDWLAARSTEPTGQPEPTPLVEALTEFVTATTRLDPTAMLDDLATAISDWTAGTAAEHHHSTPFQPPRS